MLTRYSCYLAGLVLISLTRRCLAATDDFKYVISDMAPGCGTALKVPKEARVETSKENGGSVDVIVPNPRNLKTRSYIAPLELDVGCINENDGFVQGGWAKLGVDGRTWAPNLSPKDKRDLKGAFHFYRLKATNASGWAVTVNDTIGEEDSRVRHLYYCLIHSPKALCGGGDMGYLSDGRKGDMTQYSLRILRSIKFIDNAAPTIRNAEPAGSAIGK